MPFPFGSPLRGSWRLLLIVAMLPVCTSTLSGQTAASSAATPRVPVLVELFTSEGCSDCPPADALLGKLDATQPVPGVQAIVLSEHVTYWNHQGWSDPFSFDEMTERQERYARRFGLDSTYTPQMVVNGAEQFVGSNSRALAAALETEAKTPATSLTVMHAQWADGAVQFSVKGDASPTSKLIAVLAADATHSEVARGENAGRTLQHTAVVRVMKELGPEVVDGRSLNLAGGPLAQKKEAQGPVRLVVFLVDRKSGRVLGAAQQILPR